MAQVRFRAMRPIATSNILVCGTARNVSTKIHDFLKVCDESFLSFHSVQYLICESFSTDNTVEKLKEINETRKNMNWFTDTEIDSKEGLRTARIASARNQLINKSREYPNIHYVVMADMDGVNRDLTKRAVESCWQIGEWDMVSANQPLRYYDIWALRAKGWSETDCWVEYESLRTSQSQKEARRNAVTAKMRTIPRWHAPIEVQSAFGGLAIYKKEAFLEGTYKGVTDEGKEVCEHVSFHKDLIGRNRFLLINPKLVNLDETSQILNICKELGWRMLTKLKHLMFIGKRTRDR